MTELDLSFTRNQAFLAAVVDAAAKSSNKPGGYLGRTALQKILYFLQVGGVPVTYRFEVHHYGPFCARILSDVEWLEFADVIEDGSKRPDHYSNYRPAAQCQSLLDRFADEIRSSESTVDKVVSELLPLEPGQLELYATLLYAYHEMCASHEGTPAREVVLDRLRHFKRDKFTAEAMDSAYDWMANIGLVKKAV